VRRRTQTQQLAEVQQERENQRRPQTARRVRRRTQTQQLAEVQQERESQRRPQTARRVRLVEISDPQCTPFP
jgi:hypothetical protein